MSLDWTKATTTEEQAGQSIAGLLDLGDEEPAPQRRMQTRTAPPEPPEPVEDEEEYPEESPSVIGDEETEDEAPLETAASQEDEDGPPDPETVIEPPKSWKKADRELFSSLPPEAQRIIAERANEDSRAVSRQMTQASEARKAIEAQAAQINQAFAQQQQALQTLLVQNFPELQKFQQIDWTALGRENPTEWARLKAEKESVEQRVGLAQAQLQQLQQYQYAQALEQRQLLVNQQSQSIIQDLPEYGDVEKATARIGDITKMISRYGITEAELNQLTDARYFKLLDHFAQLDKQDQARRSLQGKKAAQPAPRITGRTAQMSSDRTPGQQRAQTFETLVKSNKSSFHSKLSPREQSDLAVSLIKDML